MKLGIFLTAGDGLSTMEKSGQLTRFKKYYLSEYSENFEEVYIFSYLNEKISGLPKNVYLVQNKYGLHRYVYGILLPFLNIRTVRNCNIFRVFHLSGTIPAIITKIFFQKPFVFNYAFDYKKFAEIDNNSLAKLLLRAACPLAIRFADNILAANKNILKNLPKNKTIYSPNGVDTKVFKPFLVKTKPNHRMNILSVGRMEKQKNFAALLKAMADLPAKLTIVGNGSLKEELVDLAKKENIDLEIIDKVENDKMPEMYNRADIFVLPSLIEGHPKVLLEAMCCGLPVIGTKTEGTNEIIDDRVNGLLTGIDAADIRSAIKIFMKNEKLRQSCGSKARRTIIGDYDIKKLVNKEIKMLKSGNADN